MKVMNERLRQRGIFPGDILTSWTVIKLFWTGHVDFPINLVSHAWYDYQTHEVHWTWDVILVVGYGESSVLSSVGWCLQR